MKTSSNRFTQNGDEVLPNKIGVDLDNTILSYDKLFHRLALEADWIDGNCLVLKESVKTALRQNYKDPELGEKQWEQLQAWVYGDRIDEAEIFEGFREFVSNARARNDDMFIVSHKTVHSNFDPSVDLRRAAFNTLEKRGFFNPIDQNGLGFSKDQIFFVSSLEEKLVQIERLKLSHFIDDLPKVLLHEEFPERVQKIGFGHFLENHSDLPGLISWKDIDSYFHMWTQLEGLLSNHIVSLNPIPNSGNNRIKQAKFHHGKSWVVKEYPQIPGDLSSRKETEFGHLKALWDSGFRNIPQPLFKQSNYAVYSFIEGRSINRIGRSEMNQLTDMIVRLDRSFDQLAGFKIRNASDCRLCLKDYVDIIDIRQNRILNGSKGLPWEGMVEEFLEELRPLQTHIVKSFFQYAAQNKMDLETPRSRKEIIFSPSDFGFHNILKDSLGTLIFLDFEYSGWDDPAKLLADFFHHAAQHVSWDLKWDLLDQVVEQRKQDLNFLIRWNGIIDLIGLEWILIVLNVATESEMRRKQFSNPYLNAESLVQRRLEKARYQASNMKKNLEYGERFTTVPSRKRVNA